MAKDAGLPESFFHCPELSRREKDFLISKAQDSAKTLVEGARSANGPIRWTEAGAHNGVQMYKGEARNPSASAGEEVNYACGAVSVNATLEEVSEFFDLSTTQKMKDFAATQDDVNDGVVLYTLAEPSAANQHMHQITVKWFLGNMPSRLIKPRDFLTLECQDVFVDTTGRRGWVRSYHSVKLPCCPDLQNELGYVRGSFYHSGYVFVETDRPGWLDCIFSMQVNLKGNLILPSAFYWIGMKNRIGSVAKLSRELNQRRLGKHRFLSDLELVPKNQRSSCHTCSVKFGMLTRKTRCRKCGEVVCHQCTQLWDISEPKFGTRRVRVCAGCCAAAASSAKTLDGASLHSGGRPASVVSGHSSSSASSPERNHNQYNQYNQADYNQPRRNTGNSVGSVEYGQPVNSPPQYARGTPPVRGVPVLAASQYDYGYAYHPNSGPSQQTLPPRTLKFDKTYVTDETASLSSDFSASHASASDDRGPVPSRYAPLAEPPRRQDYYHHPAPTVHYPPAYTSSYHQPPPQQQQHYQPRYATPPPPPPPRSLQSYHEPPLPPAMDSWAHRYLPNHSSYEHRYSVASEAPSELYREFHEIPAGQPVRTAAPPPTRPPTGLSFSSDSMRPTDATTAQHDDAFDDSALYSPVSKAIADDFSSLLRIDDASRATMDSYRFSVASSAMTLHDYSADSNYYYGEQRVESIDDAEFQAPPPPPLPSRAAALASAAGIRADQNKLSVVQVYEQILQLTKQQHGLESSPEASDSEKQVVAEQLKAMYTKLSALTNHRSEIEI